MQWCSPTNDGGLVEKYEVEFRRSHRDIASTEPTSDSVSPHILPMKHTQL